MVSNFKQIFKHHMQDNINRVIIIGATSGIGRRLAELYAEKGWRIGITGRRKELLDELQKKYPAQVETECFDITQNKNIEHIKSLVKKLDGLHLIIISAGGGDVSKELSWEIDKRTTETNVNGFIEIANWAFNFFITQNHGHLVVISSIASYRGNSWAPAYSASKAFQSIYFEGLHIKARKMKKDVNVTCIEPGFVDTAMAKGNKLFWVVPVDKAAKQIIRAIEKKKYLAYISRRWWIMAKLFKWAPDWIYHRLG